MVTIYVLECEDNKYYVGKTERPVYDRIIEHFSDYASAWTKQYPPIGIIDYYESYNIDDEDFTTKLYMKEYGIENVRGGSYSKVNLPLYQIKALEMEFCTQDNLCFRCMQPGHYEHFCPHNIPTTTYKKSRKFNNRRRKSLFHEGIVCYRCGNIGHYATKCYAKTHINGSPL